MLALHFDVLLDIIHLKTFLQQRILNINFINSLLLYSIILFLRLKFKILRIIINRFKLHTANRTHSSSFKLYRILDTLLLQMLVSLLSQLLLTTLLTQKLTRNELHIVGFGASPHGFLKLFANFGCNGRWLARFLLVLDKWSEQRSFAVYHLAVDGELGLQWQMRLELFVDLTLLDALNSCSLTRHVQCTEIRNRLSLVQLRLIPMVLPR